ncbi:hypothetical protein [Lentzea flaviverrucosa]|uniref:Uncharacterized protein n=1 Tax=Lentzea flaviverrucosa TaxID=200379 RepID=A0A1H9M3N6_9PSEU|nr:hypothetical protein [Lentzea flaviverrucosa]RDI31086.1 hypothetical protein DFR72_104422 [Lentzea flaviverrucosa]SER18288.1 hypothetical protein SAMN05216195_104204 [Lentzea flaviverrucosa]
MNWWQNLQRGPQSLAAPRIYQREQWSGVLQGAEPGVEWRAEWTIVWWTEGNQGTHPAPASIAAVALRDRAAPLARAEGVSSDMMQHVLAAELGHPRPIAPNSAMWVGTENVHVELTEHSAALLQQRRERVAELAEIAHLRENVLSDLPHAVLWWLRRTGYNVEDALHKEGVFKQLIGIVNAERVEQPWARRLADALGEAMPGLEPQNRWDVFEQIQRLMKGYSHDDAADELARHLG